MSKLKVVWAFDPNSNIKELWQETLAYVESINGKDSSVEIMPVYVLSQEMVHWISNVTPPQLESIKPVTEKLMVEKINELGSSVFEKPVVLLSEGSSSRDDIEVLNNFIKSEKPDLVLLNTHQRTGVSRFFMGSFTENFLLRSHTPALVVPPSVVAPKEVNKVIVPTSFRDSEKKFFSEFIKGKIAHETEVILYSKVFHPVDAYAQSVSTALGGGWVSVESFSQEAVLDRENKAKSWVGMAQELGFKVKVQIDDSTKELAESVVDLVNSEKAQLIALPSFTGAVEAVFVGSTAREIVRQSPVPVLTQHFEV